MVLMMYSGFVFISMSIEFYVEGFVWFFEYVVYIWRLGDVIEEFFCYYFVSFVFYNIVI